MAMMSKQMKERRKKKNKFKKFAERLPCKFCAKQKPKAVDGAPAPVAAEPEDKRFDPAVGIDYKNLDLLQRMVTGQGKLVSRKRSSGCARHQKAIKYAVKRARFLALMSYTG
jgi:ribosomal protein S18